jgi:RecA-family ATPase
MSEEKIIPFEPYRDEEYHYDWQKKFKPRISNNWLVKGVLPTTGSGIIYGAPGCGKTFVTMDMALHLAAGLSWADHRVKKAKVAYLAAEGGSRVGNRVVAWERERGKPGDFYLLTEPVDIMGKELGYLLEDLEELKPGLLVIDTLNRIMRGRDENSPDGMGKVIEMLSVLESRLNCFVLVVHHSGKDESRGFRGHSSLFGAIDTSIRIKDYEITTMKQRDGEFGKSTSFSLRRVDLGEDEDGDPVTSCVVDYVRDYY